MRLSRRVAVQLILGVASVLLRACSFPKPAPQLVSSWSFDETNPASTMFQDGGPATVPMTIGGTWTDLSTPSIVRNDGGTSAYTDGTGYATIPANQPAHHLAEVTISLYYQRDSAAARQVLLAAGDGTQAGDFAIEVLANGTLTGWHTGQDGVLRRFGDTDTNLQVGTAHRVELALGGQGARYYLDGVEVAPIPANVNGWNNTRPTYLGRGADDALDPAIGTFDLLRIWDRQLTAQEIKLLEPAQSRPPPAGFSCLVRPSGAVIVVPDDNRLFAWSGPDLARYDAYHDGSPSIWRRSLTGKAYYLNKISGSHGGCWSGGAVLGTQPRDRARDGTRSFGNSAAMIFGVAAPVNGFLAEGMRVDNWWDTAKTAHWHPAENVTLRGWWVSHCRDDMVENDNGRAGFVIDDWLCDGTYMGFSGRGSKNFSSMTSTLSRCLIRLEPQALTTTHHTRRLGHGFAFKLNGGSIRLDVTDCIFAWQEGTALRRTADPMGDVYKHKDKLRYSRGNTICWLGAGDYPSDWHVPSGFTVLTGTAAHTTWDNAVTAWKAAHPLVYRIPGIDV